MGGKFASKKAGAAALVDGARGAPCEAELASGVDGRRSASGCAVVACDATIGQSWWGPSLADTCVPPGSVCSAMSLRILYSLSPARRFMLRCVDAVWWQLFVGTVQSRDGQGERAIAPVV